MSPRPLALALVLGGGCAASGPDHESDTALETCWNPATVVNVPCEGDEALLYGTTVESVIAVYLCRAEDEAISACTLAPDLRLVEDGWQGSVSVACNGAEWARYSWVRSDL